MVFNVLSYRFLLQFVSQGYVCIKKTDVLKFLKGEDFYKDTHKKNNTVSDFIINSHRSQFQRLFVAMAKGEQAKQ